MLLLISILAIGAILFFGYGTLKKTTNNFYEVGKTLHSQIDAIEFLNTPYSSLTTQNQKAIFHYCINRPWKESDEWFHRMLGTLKEADNPELDQDSSNFLKSMYKSMVGDAPIGLTSKLVGIPQEIRSLSPSNYASWNNWHMRYLKTSPNEAAGNFIAESSKAAANSYVANAQKHMK